MEFTIGADPEVFVRDAKSVRSIIGKIGGSKEIPMPLPIGDGFAWQEDNVALEFNIPASKNKTEFVRNILTATEFIEQSILDSHGLMFDKRSAVSFPQEEMYDDSAFMFGCEPDYNAWTLARNPRPECQDKYLRSCGGHIHVGVDGVDIIAGVKAMDLFLSVPAVLMDEGELRKQLYGKMGAFRQTKYGWEYRPLSNFWMFSPRLVEWAYDNTNRALEAVATGMNVEKEHARLLEAIDNNNKEVAKQLVEEYQLEVVHA